MLLSRSSTLLTRSLSFVTPINYTQRSHPPQAPLGRDESFLSTVKTAPEEWFLQETPLPTLDRSAPPLMCTVCLDTLRSARNRGLKLTHCFPQIAVPASRIYSIAQPIPFHVQLTGAPALLKQFCAESSASTSTPTSGAYHSQADFEARSRGRLLSPYGSDASDASWRDMGNRTRSNSPLTRASMSGKNGRGVSHHSTLSASAIPLHCLHMLPPTPSSSRSRSPSPYASPLSSPSLSASGHLGPGWMSAPSSANSSRAPSPLPPSDDCHCTPTAEDPDMEIRISLCRRVTISILGERTWRVQRLSPGAHLTPEACDPARGFLSWSGTIAPDEDSAGQWAPACRIGGLSVTDYVAVEVSRTRLARGRVRDGVLPHSYAVPVKLVTDPYPDESVTVATQLEAHELSALGLVL